jgi:hypothetical protein
MNYDRRCWGALFGGSPSVPTVPPVPPAAIPPTLANPAVSMAGINQRNAAAAAGGAFSGTLTNAGGAAGLVPGPQTTAGKSLLG